MIEEVLGIAIDGLRLDARLAYTEAATPGPVAVLICPPHPFLGGDMDNNVVAALAAGIAARGLPVLRFNYRGIGASECTRDLAADMAEFWADSSCPDYEADIVRDCHAALRTLTEVLGPGAIVHVIGYSFGCLPALALAEDPCVGRLGLIAPPLAKWPLVAHGLRSLPRALFHAPGDFACPEDALEQLYASLPEPRERHCYADTDHFFVGREAALVGDACRFLCPEPLT